MLNRFRGCGAAGEVSLAGGGIALIAPCALRIPVPGLNKQFGILAIADRLPSCGKYFAHGGRIDEFIYRARRQTINPGSEGLGWDKRVSCMSRSGINPDGVNGRRWCGLRLRCGLRHEAQYDDE